MRVGRLARLCLPLLVVVFWALSIGSAEDDATRRSSDEALLANLKVTAKAERYPRSAANVVLDFRGTAARSASAMGELRLDAVIDKSGTSHLQACKTWKGNEEMTPQFLDHFGYYDSPEGFSVGFEFNDQAPIQKLQEIRGSLALQLGGERKTIVVKDAFRRLGEPADRSMAKTGPLRETGWMAEPMKSKLLSEQGIRIAVRRILVEPPLLATDSVAIQVECNNQILQFDVLDATGKALPCLGKTYDATEMPHWLFWFASDRPIPSDAKLRLIVDRGGRKVRVPFVLKEIEVPPLPEEDDEKSFTGVVPGRKKKQTTDQHSQ